MDNYTNGIVRLLEILFPNTSAEKNLTAKAQLKHIKKLHGNVHFSRARIGVLS